MGAALIALLGRAIARVGAVTTVLTGVAAMALGVASLTVVSALWQLYLAFVVMAVGWSAMSGAALNILVTPWFDRRQGLALSLAFTGASMGGVVVGPAVLWIVGWLGFTTGVRVAVLAMLAVLVPVVASVLRRRPPDAVRAWDTAAPVESAAPQTARRLAYWTISVPFAAGLVAQVGFITHQVAFLTPLVGSARTALCVSLMAAAATVARLALGGIIDRMDARVAAAGNFLVQAVGFALLWWRPSVLSLYAGCLVVGLAVGNMVSLPGVLVSREFSRAQFAGVISLVTATNQVTFAFAPTLLGLLRDATGDYTAPLAVCLGLDLAAAAVVVAGRRRTGVPR